MEELTVRQARDLLTDWGMVNRAQALERDSLVIAAHQAGVSKRRIFELTGIARTTIDRIIARDNGS